MVTELVTTTGTLALQLRAARAPGRDDGVPAVRGRTPPDIRYTDERPSQGELLVLREQIIVIEYHFHVARMTDLRALGTRDHYPAFPECDDQVLFEAVNAVTVFAVYE